MGAHSYCHHCGNPQGRITIEEIAATHHTNNIVCDWCGHDRDDDTWRERTAVIAEAIIALENSDNDA